MTHQNRRHSHSAALLLIPLLLVALLVLPSGALGESTDLSDPIVGDEPTVVEQEAVEQETELEVIEEDEAPQMSTFGVTRPVDEDTSSEDDGIMALDGESTTTPPSGVQNGSVDYGTPHFYSIGITIGADSSGNATYAPGAVAGVTYTITDLSDNSTLTYTTTGDNFAVAVVDENGNCALKKGRTYRIEQTSVPSGYVLDRQTRQFAVSADGLARLGIFYVYPETQSGWSKTAEVTDEALRTYLINFLGTDGEWTAETNKLTFDLVIDQSNSMLFPAELVALKDANGKDLQVNLRTKAADVKNRIPTYVNNDNLKKALGDLDPNKVYYLVSDPNKTYTVWAIWQVSGEWFYQDAAYYYKAEHHMDGVTFPGTSYSYNKDTATNGGSFLQDIGGSLKTDAGEKGTNFTIYEAGGAYYTDETGTHYYTRLHYLQQAIVSLGVELSSLTTEATINITGFAKNLMGCTSITLGGSTDGMNEAQVTARRQNQLKDLKEKVSNITTTGSTSQDYGLQHLLDNSAVPWETGATKCSGGHKSALKGSTVILITDGAPNRGSADVLGNAQGAATQIIDAKAHFDVIGLSTRTVESAADALTKIAQAKSSGGESQPDGWGQLYHAENLTGLINKLADEIIKNVTFGYDTHHVTITDTIADSFYPIDPATNKPLTSRTLIDLDGNVLSQAPSTGAYGIIENRAGQWTVTWTDQSADKDSVTVGPNSQWHGSVYVKAKEDFIGGNAIKTNYKEATVNNLTTGDETKLDSPTVNVRLLPFIGLDTEETVFLGDDVLLTNQGEQLATAIQNLFSKAVICKVTSGTGTTMNASSTVPANYFAFGDAGLELSATDMDDLLEGKTVSVPYAYDEAYEGHVGEFQVTLNKQAVEGETASYTQHTTSVTDNEVETYTLTIKYVAYDLGTHDRPNTNVHNGTNGPGRQLVSETSTTNERDTSYVSELVGSGSYAAGTNVLTQTHKVNVIDGSITIKKELTTDASSLQGEEFTFELTRPGNNIEKFTLKAGESKTFDKLPRGTYTIAEKETDGTQLKSLKVGTDTSSWTSTDGKVLTVHIGSDTDNQDVVTRLTPDLTVTVPDNKSNLYVSYKNAGTFQYTSVKENAGTKAEATFTNDVVWFTLPVAGGIGTGDILRAGAVVLLVAAIVGVTRAVKRSEA